MSEQTGQIGRRILCDPLEAGSVHVQKAIPVPRWLPGPTSSLDFVVMV